MRKMLLNNRGSTLPMVLTVLIIVIIFSVTALTIGSASIRQAGNQELRLQAYYLARSGANAVASYIVKKAEQTTEAQMDVIISNLLTAGTSEAFRLDPADVGEIEVSVTKPSEELLVVSSTAEIGGISKTVSVDISVHKTTSTITEINKAIYTTGEVKITNGTIDGPIASTGDVKISGNPKINGTVYISPEMDPTSVPFRNSKALKGTPKIANLEEEPDFPVVDFPAYPDAPSIPISQNQLLNVTNNTGPYTITKDTFYEGGIFVKNTTLTFNRSVTRTVHTKYLELSGGNAYINDSGTGALNLYIDDYFSVSGSNNVILTLGDNDINIVTKQFSLNNGFLVINRAPGKKGVLNIYVLETFDLGGSSTINYKNSALGDPDMVNIYYWGSELSLGGSTKLAASLYVKQADITMSGSHGFTGKLVSEGQNIEITGGSKVSDALIYAPQAYVYVKSDVTGSIVSSTFEMGGGAYVKFIPMEIELGDATGSTESETTYSIGHWN